MIHGNNNHKKGPDWLFENEGGYGILSGILKLFTLQNDKNILKYVKSLLGAVETQNNNKCSFRVGDHVKIVVSESQLRERQAALNIDSNPSMCDAIGGIGNVVSVYSNGQIIVKFEKLDRKLPLNPDVLEKLNHFSVGEIVRIRDDEPTKKELQTKCGNRVTHLIIGQVGCVSKVDDGQNVSLEWLDTSISALLATKVQSDWLESLPVSESQLYELLFQMRWQLEDHFVEVANKGDLYLVQQLVQNYKVPVDVQHKSTPGFTALHIACLKGHLNVVHWLLSEQKNKDLLLEKDDDKGRRAIYFSIKGCQVETLNLLIKNGADVDPQTTRGRKTPLHKAVMKMNLECVTVLIENYCNVNLQDSEGNTPLHHSVSDTSSSLSDGVFKALVYCGKIDLDIRNVKGHTVFHSAVLAGNLSAVSSFLEIENGKIALEIVTETGSNALHLACIKGHLNVAKLLVVKKELINGSNKSGQTPLMVACWKGFYPLIQLLVEAGADINAMDENCNSAISLMMRRIYLNDLHDSDTKKTSFPSMEESPEIYEIFIELAGLPCYKETTERHPSIAFVCFLIRHGGDLDSERHWILKVRDVNVKAILERFSAGWQMSVDEEQIIVNCILCDKPASRMRFVCCGNESCMFCLACRTKNVLRCPCCNSLVKPNDRPLPIILLDNDDAVSDPSSEFDNDIDTSTVNHQPSYPKNDNNNLIQQSTDVPTIKSSDLSLENQIVRPNVIPIIPIDTTPSSFDNSINIPITNISSSLPLICPVERCNPKWKLRKGASRKGTDLEDGLGNCYTRRSPKVWQCTRQSDKQKNKCPATVRIVGGEYTVSKSHRHSMQSTAIARSYYCNTYQMLD